MAIRLCGIVVVAAAAVAAVLSLRRVANLGAGWVVPVLVVAGAALIALSRRRRTPPR